MYVKKYLSDEDRDELLDFLNEEELKLFSEINEEDIIDHHHLLGQFIRNHFGLWKDFEEGGEHPDDISYQMIVELCKYLRDKRKQNEN